MNEPGGTAAVEPLTDAEAAEALELLGHAPSPVLLAVSGGPDSTALLHLAASWAGQRGSPALLVATVDHGLRPEARAEAEAVGAACRLLGLPHATLRWEPPGGRVSQEAARAARYRLLVAHAGRAGAGALATAHTLDDQAETVLLRMAHGSGLKGLAAMRGWSDRDGLPHLRPFLRVPKARLLATCRANGWPFAEDPSNADPRFARTRWRALMPGLAAEGLDARRLSGLADLFRRADAALDAVAEQAFAECRFGASPGEVALDLGRLAQRHPAEIVLRTLRAALLAAGCGPDGIRLERLTSCAEALVQAQLCGRALRRTLAGRLLALDRSSVLRIAPEPPRRRGRAG